MQQVWYLKFCLIRLTRFDKHFSETEIVLQWLGIQYCFWICIGFSIFGHDDFPLQGFVDFPLQRFIVFRSNSLCISYWFLFPCCPSVYLSQISRNNEPTNKLFKIDQFFFSSILLTFSRSTSCREPRLSPSTTAAITITQAKVLRKPIFLKKFQRFLHNCFSFRSGSV